MSTLAIYLLVAAGVALGAGFGVVVEDSDDRCELGNLAIAAGIAAVIWPLTAVLLVLALFERRR